MTPPFSLIRAVLLAGVVALPVHAFDLQGHRGARGLAPENTLPAFQRALDLGVDTLECDMAITKDGRVFSGSKPRAPRWPWRSNAAAGRLAAAARAKARINRIMGLANRRLVGKDPSIL